MMKHMKKAISFFMAVCLLAGNSYVNTEANTTVTMSEWTQVNTEAPEHPDSLLPKGMLSYLKKYEGRVASAEDATPTPTAEPTPTLAPTKAVRVAFMDPKETGTFVEDGDDPIEFSGTISLYINGVDENGQACAISNNVTISEAHSTRPDIVKIEGQGEVDGGQVYRVVITALAPGITQISAHVKDNDNGTSYNIVCMVEVKLKVNRTDSKWETVGTEKEKVLVLNQDEEYAVKLLGVENTSVNANLVNWQFPNTGVISVNTEKGTIKAEGAGYAEITLASETNRDDSEKFLVVVAPSGSHDVNDTPDKYIPNVTFNTSSDSFALYTNGNPAKNMTWEVWAITYNGSEPTRKKIEQGKSDLLNYSVGEMDGILNFFDVKAGTYEVIGYASDKKQYANEPWNKVTFNITVNLAMQDLVVRYLNVGDTYSIVGNSNVLESRFNDLFVVTYGDNDSYVAGVDVTTGLITALNNGSAEFTVKYKTAGVKDSIYSPNDPNTRKTVTYQFHVIDALSLNTTSLSMYTDATYQLIVNTTDRSVPIKWESSNPNVVYVDPNSGLLTAKKATGSTPVQITASQIINGVEKYVTCMVYVQPAVTSVTLIPDDVILKIGDFETIKASVKPSGIAGTSLHWLSSDEGIFKIVDSTELTVTIQGLEGGTAVLTALNAENIIVGYCKVTVNQDAQGIKLSQTEVTVPFTHGSYQLYAILNPPNTTDKEIIWASQNPSIAEVDKDGLVTFNKAGTVTISAQSKDNPLLITYCTFNIQDVVNSLTLDYHALELYAGETKRLSYVLTPSLVDNPNVIWTSFDTSVATVDATGMVTAKGPGTTQIMIMSASNGSYYDICTVVVKQKATSVKMNYKEITMNRGEYFDMEVTIAPINSTEASLIWESLNTKVATVSSTGRIMARAAGTAIIAVRTHSGVTSYCTVTVIEPVISLELDPTDITIDVGEIFQIDPVFKPVEPTIKDVKWTSYNEKIATVNALGEVEGISRGSTIVTCETVDGGYRAFCLIQVMDPAMIVTINPDNYRLGYGKSIVLEVTVTNHGEVVENMPILWESSDENICTVDEYGKVTGVDYGYATIRAEVDDEYGAYATCEIRVVREVTSIRLNHNTLTIIQGHTASLKADVQPSNATYTDAIFTSDDETIAAVDEDGVITAIKPGTTWVWAKAKDNSGKYARCYVTVIEPIPATGVTVSDKQVVLVSGESKKLVYTLKPNNTTDEVTWSSANEAIATVDGTGNITAHRTGTTTVTAMTSSGKTTQVEVIVIGLSRSTLELPVYTQYSKLTVDGATGNVRWDVQDWSICEVNNGVIVARKAGTTYVTATVNGRTLKCKVTVTPNKKK